ncbi:hypothetical protein EAE96_002850 [Botrytis aclada]|nr:hypothetical protein EAE96_002850 [Botrytis aclada]
MAIPPFTEETARIKVEAAQDVSNTKNSQVVNNANTGDSIWRNHDRFIRGQDEATNDTSGISHDDKTISWEEAFPNRCKNRMDENMISREPSVDAPRSGPAQFQEHTFDMPESVLPSIEDDDADDALEEDVEKWGTQMAYLEIGSSNNTLECHAKLLKTRVPFFAQIFNARRLYFHEKYPDLNPTGLELFRKWIYGTPIAEQESNLLELMSLYIIATRFNQKSLQDETMMCIKSRDR